MSSKPAFPPPPVPVESNTPSAARIDGKYIAREISTVFNLEKGILYTMRELLIRPGSTIRSYVQGDRKRLVRPIVFIIITSVCYTLTQGAVGFEDGYVNYSFAEGSTAGKVFDWISSHYGYGNILMSFFIALWLQLFFRKSPYNYFEVLVLLCYVIGISMAFFAVYGAITTWLDVGHMDKGFLLGILYVGWAIGRFYGGNMVIGFVKSLTSYILGLMTMSISILILGKIVDWVLM